jgi:hypothetical protein
MQVGEGTILGVHRHARNHHWSILVWTPEGFLRSYSINELHFLPLTTQLSEITKEMAEKFASFMNQHLEKISVEKKDLSDDESSSNQVTQTSSTSWTLRGSKSNTSKGSVTKKNVKKRQNSPRDGSNESQSSDFAEYDNDEDKEELSGPIQEHTQSSRKRKHTERTKSSKKKAIGSKSIATVDQQQFLPSGLPSRWIDANEEQSCGGGRDFHVPQNENYGRRHATASEPNSITVEPGSNITVNLCFNMARGGAGCRH